MPHYAVSLFIFRRDLRLVDNRALNAALRLSHQIIVCFIFDPRQITPHPYLSQPALKFMLSALADLEADATLQNLPINFVEGYPLAIIESLKQRYAIEAVFFNRDYTPFSQQRDGEIATLCDQLHLDLHVLGDALLTEPEHALKKDGSAYKVFTPFYNNARLIPVDLPQALEKGDFLSVDFALSLNTITQKIQTSLTSSIDIKGGRREALAILSDVMRFQNYETTRNIPALDMTSHLSVHLKFGTVSVREVFSAVSREFGSAHPLLRQLYWRDFLTHIAFHFPRVFGHAFTEKFDQIPWENNLSLFKAWSEGKTGFPIVDAGMRELNSTGFLHNRVRMIVASFLVKDLHISWRWGERYFAQHLIDYDPCVNNGNWQWAASTGCDAQPYFRIFNPWRQQETFDPNGDYIYRWLPEIAHLPIKTLHQWDKKHAGNAYPAPIVDHTKQTQRTKALFNIVEHL
jgi:deoxyribodipyrimidine photo-lyase